MKLLYTLIILFAFSFATTYSIEYTKKGLFGSEELIVVNNAQFKRVSGTHLMFSNSTSLVGGNLIDVNCNNLISIKDEENLNKYNDCKSFLIIINNKNTERALNAKTIENLDNGRVIGRYKSPVRVIGGYLIAIGSFILIENVDAKIITEEDFQEFKHTQKIGYSFILIGGLLIGVSK